MVEAKKKKNQISAEQQSGTLYDKMHLWMISLIHDGLYGLYVDPRKLLKAAGVASGQTVLEVGCGPGFFTLPAAEIVGHGGHLYSIDLNPAAVHRVRQKVKEKGFTNVEVFEGDVARTGLPDGSIDNVFLFGIIRSLKDFDALLLEMHRVLKPGGLLAVQRTSWAENRLLKTFTKGDLFGYFGKDARVYTFKKEPGYCATRTKGQLTIED